MPVVMKILAVALLFVLASGCGRPAQRFVPMADNTALDTKTGRRCNPDPAQPKDVPADQQLPLCTSLN